MRILAFGAHPDDLEFAMGGTLIKLVDEGHEVVGAVLTKGEMGTKGTEAQRAVEMEHAARIIGYTLEAMDFHDTQIFDSLESREKIAGVIRKHRPDVVFAPYHTNVFFHKDGVAHPDHSTTGTIVRNALRVAKFKKVKLEHEAHTANHIVYYMIPKSKTPTFVCDVTKYKEKMIQAMKAHVSQIEGGFESRLLMFRQTFGYMIGAELGEPFIIEDPAKFDINLFKN